MKSWEERSSWILFVPPPPFPPLVYRSPIEGNRHTD